MKSLLREVQEFASASEHLIALAADTSISDDERALIHYYVLEIKRTLEIMHGEEISSR